jgi:hypothetical protein
MLKKLAQLDFANFQDFQDWSFVLQPRPAESFEEQHREAIQSFLELANPGQTMMNLRQLLGLVGDKVLDYDLLGWKPSLDALEVLAPDVKSKFGVTKVRELFLHKVLVEFCDASSKDPQKRTHVVDLTGHSALAHNGLDLVLNALFLAFPKWQHEHSIRNIAFFWEAHQLFGFHEIFGPDNDTNPWRANGGRGAIETFNVHHKSSGVIALWSDNMEVVADLANACASSRPDTMVLRGAYVVCAHVLLLYSLVVTH